MKREIRAVACAVLLPAILLALPFLAGSARADHGGGQDCYVCHDLSAQYVEPGTKNLNKTAMNELKGAGWTSGMPVGCVFCHRSLNSPYITNVLDSFKGTPPTGSSRHPVSRNYVTHVYDNQVFWSGDNSANAQHLDCIDCHDPALTSVPNHDNAFLASATNPFGLRSVTANKAYDTFCLLCHGTGRTSFPSGKAIGMSIVVVSHDNAVDNNANAIRDIDNTHLRVQDNTAAGYRCTVCHDAHSSTNTHLFSNGTERNPSGGFETAIDEKADCTTVCHYRGDAAGNYDLHGHGKPADWRGITLGQNCTFCHDANVPHNMRNFGTDNNYARKYRFSSLDPGWLAPSVFGKASFSVCARCHPDKAVHDTSAGAVGCLDCHDQHAKDSRGNVMMIPGVNQAAGSMLGIVGVGASPGTENVLFRKSLRYPGGDNVYHFWTDNNVLGDNTAGFCDQRACHGAGQKDGAFFIPMLAYLSGADQHSGPVFTSNDYDMNCSSCHSHDDAAGSFRASAGCTKCHGYPPPYPPGAYVNPDNVDDYYTLNELNSPHRIHAGPNASGFYNFACVLCHRGYTSGATHNTGPHTFQSVIFDNGVKNGVAAYNGATTGCANVSCHSNGLLTGSTYGPPVDNSYRWFADNGLTGGTKYNIGCGGCHPSNMVSGLHTIHRVSGYGCGTCHYYTADNAGTAIVPGTGVQYHVDGVPSVIFNPAYVGDNTPTGHYQTSTDNTCSGVLCHGQNDVVWAPGSLSCDSCHGDPAGPAPVNRYDYVYQAGTGLMSRVSMVNWATRGHGDNNGLPWDASKVPSGGGAGQVTTCLTCHSTSFAHDNGANPFRFRTTVNSQAVVVDNVDTLCDACHTFGGRSQKHARTVTGGGQQNWNHNQRCLDCHDVHGTANLFMVYDNLAYATDTTNYASSDNYGIPLYPAQRASVTFADNTLGASFASTDNAAPYTGLCEVCHARTYQYRNAAGPASGPGPHPVRGCTECHRHRDGFRGLGGSNQEQFFDNASGASNYLDRSRHSQLLGSLRYAGGRDCLDCHGRSPLDNAASTGNECLTCHAEFRAGTYHPNGLFELALPSAPGTWWNTASYPAAPDGYCLLCHDPGSASDNSLNGVAPDNVVPVGETWTGGSGHGATSPLSNDALVGPPAYSCRDCHYTSVSSGTAGRDNVVPGFHASLNRKLVGNTDPSIHEYPHPLDSDSRYNDNTERARQMDWFCGARCHGNTTNGPSGDDGVTRHTWDNLAGQVQSGSQTHPSDMHPRPGARYQNPSTLPLSDYLSGAKPGTGYVVCVTCHDPHGGANGLVRDAGIPLSGGTKQMMRRSFSDNASTICKECHL